ncbi:hypothetical protein [Winogradskyella sp.]|uniref:hypothetical protein n=1 Tax=Winogradskyella sp. TaxID=1883156 RepID=UPI00261F3CC8|nr:hypothetical protein [Winogradskyella sp.]
METYIDLINAYLDKTLSNSETIALENRLKTDVEFNIVYNEHLAILKGIERVELLKDIHKARKAYSKSKWLKYGAITVIVLFTTLMVWLLVFNNGNNAKNELRESLSFETEMTQSFNVSTDSIITITGKKGTQITINPDDLKFDSGKDFEGKNLTIELIELTNKQDLLLANAQTISNGEWLVSGGAFKIDIKSNRKSLLLKKGKTINVVFPKNTEEENMQIFYGNRTQNGYLNWELTDIKLRNKEQFVIFCKDTTIIDRIITRRFGGVETYRTFLKVDTLGYLTRDEIVRKFSEIENPHNQKDTLIIYKECLIDNKTGEISGYSILDEAHITSMNKKYNNSILTVYDSQRINDNYTKQKAFYESIDISRLGWVNIDQYSKIEDKIKVNLTNNLDFNFNSFTEEVYPEDTVWHETYLIDNESNTILNVNSSSIELPREKLFTLVSCCIVNDTFYVCRKAIKFSGDDNDLFLEYKKRNKHQIKSLLRL